MTSAAMTRPPQQVLAAIVAVETVAPRHFLLTLRAPTIAGAAQAGQFVHVLPRETSGFDPLLRRAFSIMAVDAQAGAIQILFRVEGHGTAHIAAQGVGDVLDVLGPLGQPFDLKLFHVKQPQESKPILVGGGVGVPPLVFLGQTLKNAGFESRMLLGARSAGEVLCADQLKAAGIETLVATDDGSIGHAGRVTHLLETELQNEPRAVIYSCGPLPMLRAVAEMAARFGAPCQVSLEENMPCGIGVCNGCVVAMKAPPDAEIGVSEYDRYQRVCVVGPALWADRVDWEAL